MNTVLGDFPFDEIRREDGNYFDNVIEAVEAGYETSQIWSITEGDDDSWCYGPPYHYVNHIGFIATMAHHDGATYYIEER